MGWREHLLRLLARGMETRDGPSLEGETIIRVLDRIDVSPELSARLDELDDHTFRDEFLALYEAERDCEEQ